MPERYDLERLRQLLQQNKTMQQELQEPDYSWYRDHSLILRDKNTELEVTLQVPDEDDPDDLANGLLVNGVPHDLTGASEIYSLVQLLTVARKCVTRFNDAKGTALERAKKRLEEQQAREAKEREELAAVQEARKERLLTEFMEEKGRIRMRGYKRWRPGEWRVQQMGEDYVPFFYYSNPRHGYREHFSPQVVAFEVKVGSRYRNVWSDGTEDLSSWDSPDVKESKPYDGELSE